MDGNCLSRDMHKNIYRYWFCIVAKLDTIQVPMESAIVKLWRIHSILQHPNKKE